MNHKHNSKLSSHSKHSLGTQTQPFSPKLEQQSSLKPGQRQIGRNIIDPSIMSEDESNFSDIECSKNNKRTNKNHNFCDSNIDYYEGEGEGREGNEDDESDDAVIEVDQLLQDSVIKYTTFYDMLKEKKKEMAEIKKLMDEPKKIIIQFCTKAGVNQLNVTDGKLIKNVSKKKKSLKEDIIKQATIRKIGDEVLAQSILDEINNIRVSSEDTSITLKRTYNRG